MYKMYIAVYFGRFLTMEKDIVKDWYLFSIQVASDKKMPLPSSEERKKNSRPGSRAEP